MKPVFIDFDNSSGKFLYIQLYNYLKNEIMQGAIQSGEKLPSLRALSDQTGVSITTCSRAYGQLLVEGYVDARPQSGYYVNDLPAGAAAVRAAGSASPGPESRADDFKSGAYYPMDNTMIP